MDEGQSQGELRVKGKHGGLRAGAGRKPKPDNHDAPHRPRNPIRQLTPVHVVLRVLPAVGWMRRMDAFAAVRHAIRIAHAHAGFRVIHLSIQGRHVHLLVEADSTETLAAGMQVLASTAARAINRVRERRGKVFAFRFHDTQVTAPRQARNALAYVLNNWRRHGEDRGSPRLVDKFSSAVSFDGWIDQRGFTLPAGYEPLPVAAPRSWLLRVGWRKHPLIRTTEVPGPLTQVR
jgi:REP element-mobilizing transposase RayT